MHYRIIFPLVSGSESDSKPPNIDSTPDMTTKEAMQTVPDAYEQTIPAIRDTLLQTPKAVARTLVVYLRARRMYEGRNKISDKTKGESRVRSRKGVAGRHRGWYIQLRGGNISSGKASIRCSPSNKKQKDTDIHGKDVTATVT